MRVSERYRYGMASQKVEEVKSQAGEALEKLASQKRIRHIHDDPTGFNTALKQKKRLSQIESYQKHMAFAKGFLDVSETSLSGIYNGLLRAKELGVAMASDSYDEQSRHVTALEIDQIKDQVIHLANSKYGSKYVFSGFRTHTPSLDNEGNYLGDDGKIFLPKEDGQYCAINLPGVEVFQVAEWERNLGHVGIVETLSGLKKSLEDNDKKKIYSYLNELDFQMDRTLSSQAGLGATFRILEESSVHLDLAKEQETRRLSEVEDVDIYEVTSDFHRAETLLQNTLMATTKLLHPSLLQFLQ